MPATEDDLRRVAESEADARIATILAAKPPRDAYACSVCSRTFGALASLQRHWKFENHTPAVMRTVVTPPDPTIRCGACSGPSPCLAHPFSHSVRVPDAE
jgi:hypothetical protein